MEESRPVGTCSTMCPEKERKMRLRERLIHPLECSTSFPRGDPGLVIKCYSRPAAGKEDLDLDSLRPFPVLLTTAEHLMHLVAEWRNRDWSLVYGYVQDRLRALRQDMIIQRIPPHQVIQILRIITPFYFQSSTTCRSQKCSSYDERLHTAQMEETILTLRDAYLSVPARYWDIDLLQADLIYHANDPSIWNRLIFYQTSFGTETKWKDTRNLIYSIRSINYIRFARTFRDTKPLLKHAALTHIYSLRRDCLSMLKSAYSARNVRIPLKVVSSWLILKYSESKEFLEQENVMVDGDSVSLLEGRRGAETHKKPVNLNNLDCDIPSLFP